MHPLIIPLQQFISELNQQRSTLINVLKKCMMRIFSGYGLPAEVFNEGKLETSHDLVKALLKGPGDKTYPRLPPVLYPDHIRKRMKDVFRGDALWKVHSLFTEVAFIT